MIPELVPLPGSPWDVLPAGIHSASLREVREVFGTNDARRKLCDGLKQASEALAKAGCKVLYLDGSFVTGKPVPGDYDAIWDPTGVDPQALDPVFLDFHNGRANQKARFGGEFFPFGFQAAPGVAIFSFFQTDRFTGNQKGIVVIQLNKEKFDKGGG